jgi:putative cell wall-binding protein
VPILLSQPDALPGVVRDELTTLAPGKVVLLGGRGALTRAVARQVRQALPAAAVTRIAGADRFGTSAAIASAGWTSANEVYFAVGSDFPDALAGVSAAAVHGSPLLLTNTSCLPAPVHDVVQLLDPKSEVLLGGPEVLGSDAPTAECS